MKNWKSFSLLLFMIAGTCIFGGGPFTGAWGGETARAAPAPAFMTAEDDGLIIIDLVRKNPRYNPLSTTCHRDSYLGGDLACIDLTRRGASPCATSFRRSSRFSVLLLDAEPSRLFIREGYALQSPPSRSSTEFMPMIQEIAEQHGMDPQLIYAVIEMESGFNPHALSGANAMGLMQLIPETAKSLNVRDPFDPYDNVQGGVRYLKMQLERFGNIELALAAYNAGPGAVEKHGGVPPYRETQNYVRIILDRYYQGIPAR